MNRRELSSQVFQSPRRKDELGHSIHNSRNWRNFKGNSDDDDDNLASSKEALEAKTLHRRKLLQEAKRQAIVLDRLEQSRSRQRKRELAKLSNKNKLRQILEQRRQEEEAARQAAAAAAQKKKPKRRRIIRRKIIKRYKRKEPEVPPQELTPSSEEPRVALEVTIENAVSAESEVELTETESYVDDESVINEISSDEEEGTSDHSSTSWFDEVVDDSDNDHEEIEEEIVDDDENHVDQENVEGNLDSEDMAEEIYYEDSEGNLIEEVFDDVEGKGLDDEDEFFAEIRASNGNNTEESDEQGETEEEALQREQEELLMLAAKRQEEEEEELRWEEEALEQEREAQRIAEEEAAKFDPNYNLQKMLQSRPNKVTSPIRRPKPKKDEDNVLEKQIGYRAPALVALVNQAKLEKRSAPPKEHKAEYVPVVVDAASIGRVIRLQEKVVEANGKRSASEMTTSATDTSYAAWEKHHHQRGVNRKPVNIAKRSNPQIILNEAAAVGKMRIGRKDSREFLEIQPQEREVDIDDLGDAKHFGAKVFRTRHLIDRHVTADKQSKGDWTPDYNEREYNTLDEVNLPTEKPPTFKQKTTKKTPQEIREELSREVAEGYWGRYYRLERPGATLTVTPGCTCKYCLSANAWQTYAYQKKWADERLPPAEERGEKPDPEKFGYIARLYLPETPALEEIAFVAEESTQETRIEVLTTDGTCSVDFSLNGIDPLDETDDEDSLPADLDGVDKNIFPVEANEPCQSSSAPPGQEMLSEDYAINETMCSLPHNPEYQATPSQSSELILCIQDPSTQLPSDEVESDICHGQQLPDVVIHPVDQTETHNLPSSTLPAPSEGDPSGDDNPVGLESQPKNDNRDTALFQAGNIAESNSAHKQSSQNIVAEGKAAFSPEPTTNFAGLQISPQQVSTSEGNCDKRGEKKPRRFRPLKWMKKVLGNSAHGLSETTELSSDTVQGSVAVETISIEDTDSDCKVVLSETHPRNSPIGTISKQVKESEHGQTKTEHSLLEFNGPRIEGTDIATEVTDRTCRQNISNTTRTELIAEATNPGGDEKCASEKDCVELEGSSPVDAGESVSGVVSQAMECPSFSRGQPGMGLGLDDSPDDSRDMTTGDGIESSASIQISMLGNNLLSKSEEHREASMVQQILVDSSMDCSPQEEISSIKGEPHDNVNDNLAMPSGSGPNPLLNDATLGYTLQKVSDEGTDRRHDKMNIKDLDKKDTKMDFCESISKSKPENCAEGTIAMAHLAGNSSSPSHTNEQSASVVVDTVSALSSVKTKTPTLKPDAGSNQEIISNPRPDSAEEMSVRQIVQDTTETMLPGEENCTPNKMPPKTSSFSSSLQTRMNALRDARANSVKYQVTSLETIAGTGNPKVYTEGESRNQLLKSELSPSGTEEVQSVPKETRPNYNSNTVAKYVSNAVLDQSPSNSVANSWTNTSDSQAEASGGATVWDAPVGEDSGLHVPSVTGGSLNKPVGDSANRTMFPSVKVPIISAPATESAMKPDPNPSRTSLNSSSDPLGASSTSASSNTLGTAMNRGSPRATETKPDATQTVAKRWTNPVGIGAFKGTLEATADPSRSSKPRFSNSSPPFRALEQSSKPSDGSPSEYTISPPRGMGKPEVSRSTATQQLVNTRSWTKPVGDKVGTMAKPTPVAVNTSANSKVPHTNKMPERTPVKAAVKAWVKTSKGGTMGRGNAHKPPGPSKRVTMPSWVKTNEDAPQMSKMEAAKSVFETKKKGAAPAWGSATILDVKMCKNSSDSSNVGSRNNVPEGNIQIDHK